MIADRSLATWTATFYAALGLTSLGGCGGTVVSRDGSDKGGSDSGGAASGGAPASGGIAASGGKPASGGVDAMGGAPTSGGVTASGGTTATGGATSTGGSTGFISCTTDGTSLAGYATCSGLTLHRQSKQACPNMTPRPDAVATQGTGGAPTLACTKDTDCTEKPYGHCDSTLGAGYNYTSCSYGCTVDAECAADEICVCVSDFGLPYVVGQCQHASCTQDSDCNGGLCADYSRNPVCGSKEFACQKPGDACLADSDCPERQYCTLNDVSGIRSCKPAGCMPGRPFVVDGAAVLAPLRERDDFSSGLWPDVRDLDDGNRGVIALYWAEVGLMEHASVAAFARFALELLSLGAPPSLLTATHAAMADEMVHARDAFALAGAYAARALGPGPLDTSTALANRSPLDIVRTAIIEGCIGETVAAVAASEALRQAKDPAVRAALARVVPDETRHAELAWRFVKWVLHEGPRELRNAAARELVAVIEGEILDADADVANDAIASDALRSHGVLTSAENAEIRARVLSEIVLPCARALLAVSEPARGARRSNDANVV